MPHYKEVNIALNAKESAQSVTDNYTKDYGDGNCCEPEKNLSKWQLVWLTP
jgi:hypothetical protein